MFIKNLIYNGVLFAYRLFINIKYSNRYFILTATIYKYTQLILKIH